MSEIHSLDSALEAVRSCLAKAQKEIFEQLEQCVNPDTVTTRTGNRPLRKHGIKSKNNDYREYYWITVKTASNTYWITLFYNDVDKTSGNFHTQLGRIQFWKNIQPATSKGIGSPHRKGIDNNWYFCAENSKDPQIRIDDINYAEDVVERFLDFLDESEESSEPTTKENV